MSVLVIWAVITAVFFSLQLAPGDPLSVLLPVEGGSVSKASVERIRAEFGLDKPLYVQYIMYLGRLSRLDFGRSMISNRSVAGALSRRYPATLKLAVLSLIMAAIIAIPTGVISAVHRNTFLDFFSRVFALFGISIPSFWLGLLLMLLFSFHLGWLPAFGQGGPIWTWEGIKHLILPVVTLGTFSAGLQMRLVRSSLLEVLSEDYIQTARAKGLPERVVIYMHGLRNALLPLVTVIGLQFGDLLGGAVVVETVFSWPGVGRYAVQAITDKNFPAVQGAVLFLSLGFVIVNLVVDILYCWIDPRIVYK